ncbi:glycosyltransferase family 2 protein, partial [Alicyclobacillus acidoterrestris]
MDMYKKSLDTPHCTVEAVLIVKIEIRTIEKCLTALQPAVDQIVVVDTGSTDGTVFSVQNLGIPVHCFKWDDDFAAARNYALSFAETDWVISVDADEILYKEDTDKIRKFAEQYNAVPGTFALQILQMNIVGDVMSPSRETRMFPLGRGLFWFGSVPS